MLVTGVLRCPTARDGTQLRWVLNVWTVANCKVREGSKNKSADIFATLVISMKRTFSFLVG